MTLVGPGTEAQAGAGHPPPERFHIAAPVRIGRGDSVQVELAPRRIAPVRPVILYEAMPDPSQQFQATPGIECNQFNGVGATNGHTEVALEIDVPNHSVLPDGKVRLYQRRNGRNDVVSEDALRTAAGVARLRVTSNNDITGERHAVSCNADEQRHTLHETIEVKIENRTARAADVVIREFLWRWPSWRIDGENHKGTRAGPQLQEYHVRVPASGRQVVTYTAVYSW
ncbi:MAG TPA: hypothetical protein VFK02_01860 [Kofleriaceae bacterium]|nr:hypothetical protein [Kofleriaceae bacterium]